MSQVRVGEVGVGNDGLQGVVNIGEVGLEENRLNFSEFVELNKSVLEDNLVLLVERVDDYFSHVGHQFSELLDVLALGS